jgi:hypothetical protein
MSTSGALDLTRLRLSDWRAVSHADAGDGPVQGIGVPQVHPEKLVVALDEALDGRIESCLGRPRHLGAMAPQLLYRAVEPSLANSFLTVIPAEISTTLRDADIVARIYSPHAREKRMLHTYQGWVVARLAGYRGLDGYMAALYRNDDDTADIASIWRVVGGARTVKIASGFGKLVDWTKPWHCRFNLNGGKLKAKWWAYDVIEPEEWAVVGEDNAYSRPGLMGFASTVHGAIDDNVWGIDWYAWSADPHVPAPLYPAE